MNEIYYTAIVVILGLLAVSGLFVGVTNDAVNFLISAIGSKAATMKTILIVASVGILVGVVTSTGMMEVARSGMFDPSKFSFHEVMMLYLATMFANVILIDLYNSWGLPTSTTVALVFSLLGSAIAISIFKILPDPNLSMSNLGEFINASRAMGIVSAILLSVVFSFTLGTILMYISRVIFSFRYTVVFNRLGALWCGLSLTSIIYFAIFKGLKGVLEGSELFAFVNENLLLSLFICWIASSFVLFLIQRFKINILRITILSGTFALALAFAGNDLVNFIGVPVASFEAYTIAMDASDASIMMGALNENVPANFSVLLIAGIIMILTLWTSKKAMNVTKTELSLAGQGDSGKDEYGSSMFSRAVVRGALNTNSAMERVIPKRVIVALSKRFELEDVEHSGAPYDMIRATVTLTTAALLISIATSMKLPLSTTYVCFMVAMGASLADKAWGRESAVYRISGVMTVIAGWFVTGFGGFIIAFVVGLALIYGGAVVFVIMVCLCGYMIIGSNFKKKKHSTSIMKSEDGIKEEESDITVSITNDVFRTMQSVTKIYDRTLLAVFKENRKVLRDMVKESNELFYQSRERKYTLLPTLKKLQSNEVDTAHYYVQVVDYLNEISKALMHITRPAFDHIDNNHEGLSKAQAKDLMYINDGVENIYRIINNMLREGDFKDLDTVLDLRDQLFESISDAIKTEFMRINEVKSNPKASMLYLTILNETKSMVLQSRNLLKSQRYLLEQSGITVENWSKRI